MSVKFDPAARRAIDLGMAAAERHGAATLDTLHLLAGLLDSHGSVPGIVDRLGADPGMLRSRVEEELGTPVAGAGEERPVEVAGATEEVLQRASNLARERHAGMVGDVDILAALVAHSDTAAARLLASAGITAGTIERELGPVAPGSAGPARIGATEGASAAESPPPRLQARVGLGYDSHRFGGRGPLRLGGVDIEHRARLVGHSDGDAIAHALTDAILGAAGLGDIGEMFPDSAPANRGRDSLEMLRSAASRVREAGWRVAQADVTVIAESPKLSPHRAAIRAALASALGIEPASIGVKGKTNEGMGWVGRGEGVACIAVAMLSPSA